MAETGNTKRTQLINLEGLSTFLDESKKIFEPTLPPGTDGQVLKLSNGTPTWEVSNEFDEIRAKDVIAGSAQIDLVSSKRVKIDGQIESPQLELVANKVVINEQLGAETLRLESPSVKGNADTSSKLKTAVSLTITDGSHTSEGVDFDGSKAISIKLPSTIAATFSGNLTGDIAGNATTATTAEKLGTSAGGLTKPIYFSEGKPAETGYTFADTISSSATDNNKKIPTSSAIISYVGSALRASDAMIYKGTIGAKEEGGTVQELPSTTALTGWTYKVITAGTYAGVSCEVGDMIICLTDGSSDKSATWTVVQANIDGAVISGLTSATDGHIPLFSGTTGKVIKSSSKSIVSSITGSENIPTDNAVKTFVENKGYVTSSGVTSVGLDLPDIFSVTGSPVASTGTLTGSLNKQEANKVFAGPSSSGPAAVPDFRKLVAADLPGTYAGSSSAGGAALTSEKLEGFNKSASQSWGLQKGTFVHGEEVASANEEARGCCWAFRKDCPSPGLISLFVDGKFYQDEGRYACIDTNGGTITGSLSVEGITSFTNGEASTSTSTGAVKISGGLGVGGDIYAGAVHNAVWNDLADCIPVDDECKIEPGYCYCFDGERYYKSTKYLDEGIIGIDSDTYGMSMGHKSGLNQMDVAVAGFVLAYVDREYKPGTPLTCTENGYLTEIKKEDKIEYPERIVATYWKNEPAGEWGSDDRKVKVNGRKWVKVV